MRDSVTELTVAVVGSSGFVGRAVTAALETGGVVVRPVVAPRLRGGPSDVQTARAYVHRHADIVEDLARQFCGCSAVVNAAGNPDASEADEIELYGPNALLPAIVGAAAAAAGVDRYVHVSSAVVQGDMEPLDESHETVPLTSYAHSKADGERLARGFGPHQTVVYRPPSVHGEDRRITRWLNAFARSPIASVAGTTPRPTPQALVGNVGSAVAFLATSSESPPDTVMHPWEGCTTSSLLKALGGKDPVAIPWPIAKLATKILKLGSGRFPILAPNARRLEVLWLGQAQSTSWLTRVGWAAPLGLGDWEELGRRIGTDKTPLPRPSILFGVTTGIVARPFFEGQFAKLRQAGWQVALVSPNDGSAGAVAQREGAEHIVLHAARRPSPFQDARTLVHLLLTLRRRRPTVAVWGTPKIGLLGTLAGRLTWTPSVYVVHGLRFESALGVRRFLLEQAERIACTAAHEVVAVGFDVRRELVSRRISSPGKTRVLGWGSANGVTQAVPSDDARVRLGIPEDATVFGFVGRVTGDKGIRELLTAWSFVRETNEQSMLVVAGMLEPDIDKSLLARTAAHDDRCLFLGHMEDLTDVYSAMDVLVLPTYREGLPTVVLEAASYGVPSIVTDVTGARECVEPGVTGLVIPAKDAGALADAMGLLGADSASRVRLGASAGLRVAQLYERRAVQERWVEFFDSFSKNSMSDRQAESLRRSSHLDE